jgi:hypothetical protein
MVQQLARELEMFAQEIARSELPAADVMRGVTFESWDGALTFLATSAGGRPQVIVMNEFPYLLEQDPSLEATLQKVWDRYLRKAPVLLVLIATIGSGERTFTTIQRRAGIHETTLQRALAVLVAQKRMVSAERPLSRETHYAVADPYLRF